MTGEGGSVGRWATVLVATALSVLVWFAMSAAAGPPGSPSSLGSGHSIQITPDGSIAVYMATAGLEAVAIDASGPPQLLDAAARSLIGLTPSGSHVVYRADVTGGMELRSVPVNGGTPTRLSDAGGHTSVGRVALADEGSSGVYIAWDGVDQSMWAYTTDGSAPHHLVTAAFSDPAAPVDWMTPDGAHGVYRVGSDLFAIATDGLSDPVQLSGDSAADGSVLAWLASPDSSWVAYTTNNGSGTVPAPLRAARIDGTDRQRLDDRGEFAEYLEDLPRDLAVVVVTRRHDDRVRAATARERGGLRGVTAVAARLVARRRDYPPSPGAADEHRFTRERRVIADLDGGEERVHVDVKERPGHSGSSRRVSGRRLREEVAGDVAG